MLAQTIDSVAASMIERFGNPQAEDAAPRRTLSRSTRGPAPVPSSTPIIWDTPHEMASDGAGGGGAAYKLKSATTSNCRRGLLVRTRFLMRKSN
jgi:hypothetical protein